MAKRGAGAGTFSKWVNSIPAVAEFTIVMADDSTAEAWADIDTDIDDKQAWAIYGLEYDLETIDPTVPLNIGPNAGNPVVATLQIHRNDDSEVLLNKNDSEVMFHHSFEMNMVTSGAFAFIRPFQIASRQVTMQPTLRAIFRTSIDWAGISAATNQLTGKIYYDTIPAPAGTATKIGQLSDL